MISETGYFVAMLNDFSKILGGGVLIVGIVGIVVGITSVFWLFWKINDKLSIERYEKDREKHEEEHLRVEQTINAKLNQMDRDINLKLDTVSKVVHKVDGYLIALNDLIKR